jgi:acyl-CoA thioesterase-1
LSSGYGISIENSWTKLLGKKIKERNLSLTIVNSSISGETTSGGIRRLPKLLSKFSPSIVIIELGANDALRGLPLKQTKKNLTSMVDLSKKNGAKPLLVGMRIPPNYGKSYSDNFFEIFGQIAVETKIPIVPFMFKGFSTDKNFFLEDQIHPNEKAQIKILENIWGELEPLL